MRSSQAIIFGACAILIPSTIPHFQELYQAYKDHPGKNEGGHVCVHADGVPFEPSYVSRGFKRLLKRHGLPEIRFHELRHTAGSLLLESGMNPKQIQEYMGHEDVQTTLETYTHLTIEGKAESAKVMGSLLSMG